MAFAHGTGAQVCTPCVSLCSSRGLLVSLQGTPGRCQCWDCGTGWLLLFLTRFSHPALQVRVALQLDDGSRLQDTFSSGQNLWELLSHFAQTR